MGAACSLRLVRGMCSLWGPGCGARKPGDQGARVPFDYHHIAAASAAQSTPQCLVHVLRIISSRQVHPLPILPFPLVLSRLPTLLPRASSFCGRACASISAAPGLHCPRQRVCPAPRHAREPARAAWGFRADVGAGSIGEACRAPARARAGLQAGRVWGAAGSMRGTRSVRPSASPQ